MLKPPRSSGPQPPYPDLRSAFMLTLLAILATLFTGVLFIGFGALVAIGVGQAIGVGAVATMAAQRVPEPQAERLGLRPLQLDAIPVILCLAPAILLVSELDNYAADWSTASTAAIEAPIDELPSSAESDQAAGLDEVVVDFDAVPAGELELDRPTVVEEVEQLERPADLETHGDAQAGEGDTRGRAETDQPPAVFDADDPWSLLQLVIVMVGIAPIVEEFFFRGVIQQGLVLRMGMLRGVAFAALLSTLARPVNVADPPRFLAAALAFFVLGWGLGIVRIATQSVLGSMLLASTWAGVGVAALALQGEMDLPGMNVEGTHLPGIVTLVSAVLVGWAGWTLYQEALRRFDASKGGPSEPPEPPLPPVIPLRPRGGPRA